MLEKISDPSYTSPELSAELVDMMTNTAFEDRLSEGARAAIQDVSLIVYESLIPRQLCYY